ncbi:nicotinate (nicotinamide) nucleotide adenylyltransferase [bacterium]|jgi:nicotinate-nucleotide adenylyltransferase|nr:nicotinate (nicotinamide) nucleotide adenylyltransferase [bacterium]MBT7311695.1 nicotinate (nicotinamide) nucleotide adenylyltransferase [bacterium]
MVVGIYGGAFDPVHNGHLALVNELLSSGVCSRIKLIPAAHSPLKNKASASQDDRLNMLKLAVDSNSFVEIDELEINRSGVSWTIETIRTLTENSPQITFKLIIGQDNLDSFDKWKNYEEILDMVDLIVIPRGDGDMVVPEYLSDKCQVLEGFSMPQSSSKIRKAISCGAVVKDDLPASVFAYIRENNLYSTAEQIPGD